MFASLPRHIRWFYSAPVTLVVCASIAVWALSLYWEPQRERVAVSWQEFTLEELSPNYPAAKIMGLGESRHDDGTMTYELDAEFERLNPKLLWPAIALIAYIVLGIFCSISASDFFREKKSATLGRRGRRWFSFSLRTMFIMITLVAIIFGYHIEWMRQRHAFVDQAKVGDRSMVFLERSDNELAPPRPPTEAPGLLRLCGEHGYFAIHLTFGRFQRKPEMMRELSPEEESIVDRVKQLFPEAVVTWKAFKVD